MPTDYELKLEACDMIQELLDMLHKHAPNAPLEVKNRMVEIEDFAVNYLGED